MPAFRLSLYLLALTLLSGCHFSFGPAIVGSGILLSETRDVATFDGIQVSGALKAEVTIGDEITVELSGDDNLIPLVTTEVEDGVLRLGFQAEGPVKMKEPIVANITTPKLESLNVSGASQVSVDGLEANTLKVELSGASAVALAGHSSAMAAEISGASKLNASELKATNVSISSSGASSATVWASEDLDAEASGASKIHYLGEPADVRTDFSGASSIVAKS